MAGGAWGRGRVVVVGRSSLGFVWLGDWPPADPTATTRYVTAKAGLGVGDALEKPHHQPDTRLAPPSGATPVHRRLADDPVAWLGPLPLARGCGRLRPSVVGARKGRGPSARSRGRPTLAATGQSRRKVSVRRDDCGSSKAGAANARPARLLAQAEGGASRILVRVLPASIASRASPAEPQPATMSPRGRECLLRCVSGASRFLFGLTIPGGPTGGCRCRATRREDDSVGGDTSPPLDPRVRPHSDAEPESGPSRWTSSGEGVRPARRTRGNEEGAGDVRRRPGVSRAIVARMTCLTAVLALSCRSVRRRSAATVGPGSRGPAAR